MDLVFGGHGFLGGHLCQLLESYHSPHYRELYLRPDKVYRKAPYETTYHLGAWVGGIGFLRDKPHSIFDRNLDFALKVFFNSKPYISNDEKFFPTKNIIVAGSVCEYPHASFMTESMINHGEPTPDTAGYGYAKRAIYNMGRMFEQEHGVRVLHCILTNLYGPGDKSTHVVAELVRKFCDAKKRGERSVDVWGDGEATRDLLYVSDAARMLKEAGERYYGPAINLATGVETTIRELAETIAWACDYTGKINYVKGAPVGEKRRQIDISKALNCKIKHDVDLDDGIKETVKWYQNSI